MQIEKCRFLLKAENCLHSEVRIQERRSLIWQVNLPHSVEELRQ